MKTNVTILSMLMICLFTTNGTGQQLLKNINPDGDSHPGAKVILNDHFYFIADDGVHGFELWKSDGTPVGTQMVKDINSGGSGLRRNEELNLFGNILYFVADDGIHGRELWRSDGSEEGTFMVHDINPAGDSYPNHLSYANGKVYFSASDGVFGVEPWVTNQGIGAEMIKDIYPDGHSFPFGFIGYQDMVIFVADDGIHGTELWKTDGTEVGTVMITDLNEHGDSKIRSLIQYKDMIYFIANVGLVDSEYDFSRTENVWRTNGEESGTEKITTFENYRFYEYTTAIPGGIVSDIIELNGYLHFWSSFTPEPYNGAAALFSKSDGTTEGTIHHEICSIYCGVRSWYKIDGGNIYIIIGDEIDRWVIYFNGSELVYYPTDYQSEILYFFNGKSYINAYYYYSYPYQPPTLVKGNGTSTTILNPDIRTAQYFFPIGDLLYFTAYDEVHENELWVTDGSARGTQIVKDINLAGSSYIEDIIVLNDVAYFTCDNGIDGRELWKFDPSESFFATEVVSFDQGTLRDGKKISEIRSDPSKSLGPPQENDTYNFVSLGFGGQITLKLGAEVYDDGTTDPEIIVVETSFGRADQMCYENGVRNYPEMALVELSHDGISWYSLPNSYCRTSFLDISPAVRQGMPYARYIRLTENSDKQWFDNAADGYDVDGIITSRNDVLAAYGRLTDARKMISNGIFDPDFFNYAPNEEQELAITFYPIPVFNELKADTYLENGGACQILVTDLMGRTVINDQRMLHPGQNQLEINTSTLPGGHYLLQVQINQQVYTRKFVKQ